MREVQLNVECFFYPSHLLSPPLFPPLGACYACYGSLMKKLIHIASV